MQIFPVYCFQGYAKRVDVFHAFSTEAASDFATGERWENQPNGFYLAPSREIACCALTGRPFHVNENDMAGNNMNPHNA